MNSVANGKVTTHTPFKNAWIPAGASDNGTCFGAAFAVWQSEQRAKSREQKEHRAKSEEQSARSRDPSALSSSRFALGPPPRRFRLTHAYWGPSFTNEQCRAAAVKYPVTITELPDQALFERIVDALCEGKVIGWFQGRMEFGARALGSRSLLADPRRADMRDIINLKIKFREKFRPFAPSILAEHVRDWFEIDEASPFMEKVLPIRAEKRSLIPSVTHVDGSGRLQTVTRETNGRYYELISAFCQRTSVPLLLNTSLNENEPIVHTPEQAIDCFLRTQMDAIVLENLYLERNLKS
jgi:carbamoyltransferase